MVQSLCSTWLQFMSQHTDVSLDNTGQFPFCFTWTQADESPGLIKYRLIEAIMYL